MTNQLTTKVGPANDSHLVPALGDSFGHYSNQRLMLGCLQHKCYAAVLFKSVQQKQSSAKFQVIFAIVFFIWHVIRKSLCFTMSYLCTIYISDTEEWYSGLRYINKCASHYVSFFDEYDNDRLNCCLLRLFQSPYNYTNISVVISGH